LVRPDATGAPDRAATYRRSRDHRPDHRHILRSAAVAVLALRQGSASPPILRGCAWRHLGVSARSVGTLCTLSELFAGRGRTVFAPGASPWHPPVPITGRRAVYLPTAHNQ